ncbi:MAG: acetyl-CoA carboxylase biotin carboxyl carrier protein [Planctomycetaceae bacterium]|nr:acetyl-CoA carboxylase biotin carboxyl carrier protein [Planctomycetaceae bacterium]
MADSKSADDGFDLERLQQLVELMEKHDLRQVKLKKGSEKWFLSRGPQEVMQAIPMPIAPPLHMSSAAHHAPPPPAAGSTPATAPKDDGLAEIKSPMVGTFYRAASPDDPPFAKEGDRVSSDSVVCLVEAMKFFNQIKAECNGTITKVLVQDGDAVEFGQPLFKVKPD